MTKAQVAEEARKRTDMAVIAMGCTSCPYDGCIGSPATLTWDEYTRRRRGEVDKGEDEDAKRGSA